MVYRSVAALTAIGITLTLAGCGGSGQSGDGSTTTAEAPPSGSLEALWRDGAEAVAVVPGTSDYGVGENRVSFLVVDRQSKLIERPQARLLIARGLRQKPFAETTATLEPIGIPGGVAADAQNIYVATVSTPTPGKYWILAVPTGGRDIKALGNVVVRKRAEAPEVGDRAIPSRNPTLVTDAPAASVRAATTAEPPDFNLLRTTVAAAMAAKRPFVVSFATPLYCQTRTCGPVVQVVQSVARDWQSKGVDFIHIEIYEDNDPSKGTNRWVDEWNLPTEPFTFVVDSNGIIRTRLEGAFSPTELEAAVRKVARLK